MGSCAPSQYTSAPLKIFFNVYLAHIRYTVYTVYNTTTGMNKYDTIHAPLALWQCTCCTVYNIMQSENTTGYRIYYTVLYASTCVIKLNMHPVHKLPRDATAQYSSYMNSMIQNMKKCLTLPVSFCIIALPLSLSLSVSLHPSASRVNDDGAGDGKNSKIVQRLMPDRDYYLQIQTFDPKGGKFEFSITAW